MHEICFIDDTIPVASVESINDADRLNRSNLKLLLNKGDTWPEAEVRALVDALLADESTWNVSAFIHPNIYLNSVENESYRPDIIIYDWEYAGGTDDSSTILLEILKTTYAVVYIYSGADHKTQIDQALQQTELRCFKDRRLFLLMKNEDNSQEKLLSAAKNFYDTNFSFRFGSLLRTATIKALDKVLVDLGSHDIDFVTRLLADGETEETDIKGFVIEKVRHYLLEDGSLREMLITIDKFDEPSINELLTFLVSKVTDTISAVEFGDDLSSNSKSSEEDNEISRRLWSQRIYYQPSDSVVRRGDIVREKESSRYFLVITADCDLNRFWNKNFGFINLVPLYSCSRHAEEIKSKLRITRNENQLNRIINNMKAKSLTGKVGDLVEGPFICPFLSINDDDVQEFIGFPKEIMSVHIAPPSLPDGKQPGERKKMRLTYTHWDRYERVTTISEPFLTALIQHCVSAISGYGTPDYPEIVQNALKEGVKSSLLGDEESEKNGTTGS